MPTFYIVNGVKIELFFNDHAPPHFHAVIAEYDALISIEDGKIIKGNLPVNKRKQIIKWAIENKENLKTIWDELN